MVLFKREFLLCLTAICAGLVLITVSLTSKNLKSIATAGLQWGNVSQQPKLALDFQKGKGDRKADNGVWFEQTSPFRLVAYTAFYDDRSTLTSSGPRIVAIVQSAKQVDCCVWFEENNRETRLHSEATGLGPGLLGCQLKANLSSIPTSVSFCWRTSIHNRSGTQDDNQFTATTFRVPVERVGKISASSGKRLKPNQEILLCLSNLHGEVDPVLLVEWIEMNFILGISRIVIYNHSASKNALRVLQQYADANDSSVELRQSNSAILDNGEYGHQDPTIHDCLYRHAGLFQYIAIWDSDELIVPRQPNVKLLDLVKALSGNERVLVGAFEFRNAYFHLEFPATSRNVSGSSKSVELNPLPSSRFLSRRHRGGVWPYKYIIKNIMNTESCVVPWTHGCKVWTPAYEVDSTDVIREVDVPPTIALKHHYRYCQLEAYGGNCKRDRAVSRPDDVMLRYADELALRLQKTYSWLNLHVAAAQQN